MSKQYVILIPLALLVMGLAIWGGSELAVKLATPDESTSSSGINTNVNPHAKVSAEGFPLPSEAKEDLRIELTDTDLDADFSKATVLYDYETEEYELLAFDSFGPLSITYDGGKYYTLDTEQDIWYEISEGEAKDVFDISSVYFSQDIVDSFLSSAVFIAQAECGSGLCASWQVVYGDDGLDSLTIRVDNQTRKIYDINGIGQSSSYTLNYIYQDVTIDPPSPLEAI